MTTAKELYEMVLIELRKQGTMSLTPKLFNYHVNAAQITWVADSYQVIDATQRSNDLVSVLEKRVIIANTGGNAPGQEIFIKPVDFKHFLACAFRFKYYGVKCIVDGTEDNNYISAKKLFKGSLNKVVENHYTKPMAQKNRVFYDELENDYRCVAGASIAKNMKLDYLRYPVEIKVNETTGESVLNPEPKYQLDQIISLAKYTASQIIVPRAGQAQFQANEMLGSKLNNHQ
jgi:hypothetical protein